MMNPYKTSSQMQPFWQTYCSLIHEKLNFNVFNEKLHWALSLVLANHLFRYAQVFCEVWKLKYYQKSKCALRCLAKSFTTCVNFFCFKLHFLCSKLIKFSWTIFCHEQDKLFLLHNKFEIISLYCLFIFDIFYSR